ncbi:MAG: hypothetical protein GY730_01935, partial [bacterium]|nr:hypothetical protein [bacterium]
IQQQQQFNNTSNTNNNNSSNYISQQQPFNNTTTTFSNNSNNHNQYSQYQRQQQNIQQQQFNNTSNTNNNNSSNYISQQQPFNNTTHTISNNNNNQHHQFNNLLGSQGINNSSSKYGVIHNSGRRVADIRYTPLSITNPLAAHTSNSRSNNNIRMFSNNNPQVTLTRPVISLKNNTINPYEVNEIRQKYAPKKNTKAEEVSLKNKSVEFLKMSDDEKKIFAENYRSTGDKIRSLDPYEFMLAKYMIYLLRYPFEKIAGKLNMNVKILKNALGVFNDLPSKASELVLENNIYKDTHALFRKHQFICSQDNQYLKYFDDDLKFLASKLLIKYEDSLMNVLQREMSKAEKAFRKEEEKDCMKSVENLFTNTTPLEIIRYFNNYRQTAKVSYGQPAKLSDYQKFVYSFFFCFGKFNQTATGVRRIGVSSRKNAVLFKELGLKKVKKISELPFFNQHPALRHKLISNGHIT